MRKFPLYIFVGLSLLLAPPAFADNSKRDFWNQQRRGANCFNKTITTNYFPAARAAGPGQMEVLQSRLRPQKMTGN